MNINNINNSGNGNIFNQNIGSRKIYDIRDCDVLAKEWVHRNTNCQRARRSRYRKSLIELIVAVISVAVSLIVIQISGGFDDLQSFINFVGDVTANLVAAVLTAASGFIATVCSVKDLARPSDVELRNKKGMKLIDDHATDLGFSKKAWKAAKKKATSR